MHLHQQYANGPPPLANAGMTGTPLTHLSDVATRVPSQVTTATPRILRLRARLELLADAAQSSRSEMVITDEDADDDHQPGGLPAHMLDRTPIYHSPTESAARRLFPNGYSRPALEVPSSDMVPRAPTPATAMLNSRSADRFSVNNEDTSSSSSIYSMTPQIEAELIESLLPLDRVMHGVRIPTSPTPRYYSPAEMAVLHGLRSDERGLPPPLSPPPRLSAYKLQNWRRRRRMQSADFEEVSLEAEEQHDDSRHSTHKHMYLFEICRKFFCCC